MSSVDSHNTLRPPQFEDSALDVEDSSPALPPASSPRRQSQPAAHDRRFSGRVSFSSLLHHRPSFASRWKRGVVDEEAGVSSPRPERPLIPSALQPPPEVYSTPLPILSMIVLSIVGHILFIYNDYALRLLLDYVGRILVCKRFRTISAIHGRR